MINQIASLTQYQKQVLLKQARSILEGWNESGNPVIVDNEVHLNNEDQGYLVLYKCECNALIADYDDYSGRDIDTDRCPKCGKYYDYSEGEL